MPLKPQDLLLVLKLQAGQGGPASPLASLADALGMSLSEVHAATKRAGQARLLVPGERRPITRNLLEFVEHGAAYAFYPERVGMTRGLSTAYAAPPMNALLVDSDAPALVWPWSKGETRGEGLKPLYRSVPIAASKDPKLYELLVLLDSIRAGSARERKIAQELFRKRMVADTPKGTAPR